MFGEVLYIIYNKNRHHHIVLSTDDQVHQHQYHGLVKEHRLSNLSEMELSNHALSHHICIIWATDDPLHQHHIHSLVQVCGACNSIANALELLQSCSKPLMYTSPKWLMTQFPDTYICISGWTSVNQCAGSSQSGPSDMKPVTKHPGNCQQPVTEWCGFLGHNMKEHVALSIWPILLTLYIENVAVSTDEVGWRHSIGHPSICPERFLGISWIAHGWNGLKFGILISCPPTEIIWFWSWSVDFSSFGAILTQWNGGFQAFSSEILEEMAWNVVC